MSYLISVSPVFLFVLLLILRFQIHYVAAFAFVYTAALAVWQWSIALPGLGAAFGKGALLTSDIFIIIFGAIVYLNYLKKIGILKQLEVLLGSLSPDRRIQAILLAWFFGSFIEGTSGFGTPALVVAPLLVGIGFSTTLAIVVCLTANSTAVIFGAVGTPIRIGLAGLDIAGVSENAALINLFAGVLVPVLILAFVVVSGPKARRSKDFFECLPWAIFSGLAFLIPYYAVSRIGFEFPSIVGASVGMAVAVISIRFHFLIPKSSFRFSSEVIEPPIGSQKSSIHSLLPYVLLIFVLVSGKLLLSDLNFSLRLGHGLSHTIQFFNPGFAFLTTVALLNFFKRMPLREIVKMGASSLGLLTKTAMAICCVAAMTYTMLLTGTENNDGMLQVIAKPLSNAGLPFFSGFIGAFGSFLAGSATVSNLLFAQIQVQAAEQLGFNVSWIIALQLVGAGVGNMIALPNLLAVQASVNVFHQEAKLLRFLAVPCFLYLLVAGLIGHIFTS